MDFILKAKVAAAQFAVGMVESGMTVGLGSGTTSACFIDALIERCKEGLKVEAVATSLTSEKQAQAGGIPFIDMNDLIFLDICFDGADEIDPQKRMIKGGGGALLREKIVASMSKKVVILVDETKCVSSLGKFPLAVEIEPFGYSATVSKLRQLGYHGFIRKNNEGLIYKTDNGNYIYDVHLPVDHQDVEKINADLIAVIGVIETGFFFNLATHVVVGKMNGEVEFLD